MVEKTCAASLILTAAAGCSLCASMPTLAANHLDTPTVIAEPRADIGDLFAWMSPDTRRLNLAMTIVGRSFSDQLSYVFHVDSGKRFGETTKTTTIECTFTAKQAVDCKVGEVDRATGDASAVAGLDSKKRHFKVFAGLRDDPFFNNVKGPRAGYNVAAEALTNGTSRDAASCPQFGVATSERIRKEWRSTSGGPLLLQMATGLPISQHVRPTIGQREGFSCETSRQEQSGLSRRIGMPPSAPSPGQRTARACS